MQYLCNSVPAPFIIDDSGLEVDALRGFPGVYSAYVYKTLGCAGILRLLTDGDRAARFRCVIGLADGTGTRSLTGICEGSIASAERGKEGFGYDPIFLPRGSGRTFAEMSTAEKNALSHRGKALAALARHLKAQRQAKKM